MLTSVRIRNYRCLRDVTLELGPLTVLVGPNASGKSAVLEALSFDPANTDRRWRNDPRAVVAIQLIRDGRTVEWPGFETPSNLLRLHCSLSAMRTANQLKPEFVLAPNAGNLHDVLFQLGRSGIDAVSRRFCALIPAFRDLDLTAVGEGQVWTRFQDRWTDSWYDPTQVSDGSLFVLAYLVAAVQRYGPSLLLIEEPERGLHPWLLEQVVVVLRSLAAPADDGRPVQIVAATHSVEFLRHLRPEEVRFLDRDPADGATRVRAAPTSDPAWGEAIEAYEHSVAEMWLSGALGGVPGR